MKRSLKKMILFSIGWGAVLFFMVNSSPVNHYVQTLTHDAIHTSLSENHDEMLRKQIEEWRLTREQKPINARVDRVWHAIPGYNGLVVDVDASLVKMAQTGIVSPDQLQYKQVPPSVTLEQLGAHPIYRGNEQKQAVSFMVNVAWGNEHLDPILNTLDQYGIKTTFFLDGSWVRKYPQLAKKIAERGHEIGNHAFSHPDMSKLSDERIRQEIGKTQAVIKRAIGITPRLFAPPSGAYNERVVSIASKEYGLKTIMWTADTVDWQKPSLQEMVLRVSKQMGNGVLVLMHPTEVSARGLEQLIKAAKQKGLSVTTVSELLSEHRPNLS